ncbi:MAG: signal peptide peptidase SppA [Candidatus Cloacimonadales bacterium]
MKRILVVILLLAVGLNLLGQVSVADTDNFLAAEKNVAAVAYGNAGGLGIKFPYAEDIDFGERISLFVSGESGGYLMNKTNDFYQHKLFSASEIFHNFYLGTDWLWENGNFADGAFNLSTLYRPHNAISVGLVANDIFYDTRNYLAGIALRPTFLGAAAHRLSFSADWAYIDEEFSQPLLGVQTQLLDGITLGGSYDLESEAIGINFGLNFGTFQVGSQGSLDDDNREYPEADYYFHASDKMFRSLFSKPQAKGFYEFKTKPIVEKKSGAKFGRLVLFMDESTTLQAVLQKIEDLKNDPTIEGIVIKKPIRASMANLNEIRQALLDFKASGKTVVFYAESMGNIGYAFAASVADEIYLYKTGSIDLKGISISSPYLRDLMDKLGLKMENFRSHKYKTAGNMFSETEMTIAERESYDYLLQGLYEEMILLLEARSNKLKLSAEETIDNGPYYVADKALEYGLVDGLIYEDELEDLLAENHSSGKISQKLAVAAANQEWSKPATAKIAIIYAIGSIHMGEGQPGKSIGSQTTAKAIRQARQDKSVQGIVLVVNSGGGSALASDIIGREVELCHSGKNQKPIVAVMTGTAASGGYYISAKADKIIAQPSTVTGSIGVIGMLLNMEGLYEKIGVNWSTVKKGNFSDLGNSSREMSDEERRIISESIENVYWQFVDVVAEGRNMSSDEVHAIAQGRIWTGKQAMKRGLVDMMGGIDTGVEQVKQLANITDDARLVEFLGYDKSNTFELNIGANLQLSLPEKIEMLKEVKDELQLFENEKVLLLLPKLEIK